MFARRLLINHMHNMRELGGYPTRSGGITRPGSLIRSDSPDGLPEEAVRWLWDYGVRLSVDLRTGQEAAEAPSPLAGRSDIAYCNIPFTEDFTILGRRDFCPRDHYVPILRRPHRIPEILEAIAGCEGGVIFHCSAGKDRTGIIAALLLLLAGVPEEDVIADYQVTYTYIKDIMEQKKGDPTRPTELCKTHGEWLEPLLEYLREQGGARSWLLGQGVGAQTLDRLENRLAGVAPAAL